MFATALLKSVFILAIVLFGIVPILAWIDRKQSAVTQDRLGRLRADVSTLKGLRLFQPLADALKLLPRSDFLPAGANRVRHLLPPLLALIPALTAFAIIPFAGIYQFGDRTLDLVVSDADWGMLTVFGLAALASYGTLIAGWSSGRGGALRGSLAAAVQVISCQLTLGLSLVGVFMVFETVKLQDMALAQDTSMRAFGFLDALFGPSSRALDWIRLPAWGVFSQPLAFALFLASSMAASQLPPFGPARDAAAANRGEAVAWAGMRCGLLEMAEFVQLLLIAALTATLFLGGWSVPYLSTSSIVSGVSALFGASFANGLCLVLQFGAFLLKVGAVIALQLALRWSLPRFRTEQIVRLWWQLVLPLALVNFLVTGFMLLMIGEAV